MKSFLLLALVASAAPVFAQSHRLHVRQNASGANDGTSWHDAFSDLHAALDAAVVGDTVWAAEGTYLTSLTGDRDKSFRVKSGVRVYGGFAGIETALSERDWATHPTVLSGAIGGLFYVDDARHIMFLENPDSSTAVDGLVFKNGFADSNNEPRGGAAIFVLAEDSILWKSALRVRNCRFELNKTNKTGGAVRVSCYGADRTRFENCVFNSNDAEAGGAVAVHALEIHSEFVDCQFFQNEAGEGGGAVFLNGTFNVVRFLGCHFEKNSTKKFGGGAVFHEGGTLPGKGVLYSDCHFVENWCETAANFYPEGGGLYLRIWGGTDTVVIEGCVFSKNRSYRGAAVFFGIDGSEGGNFKVQHCRFEENETSDDAAVQLGCFGGCGEALLNSVNISNCLWSGQKGHSLSIEGTGLPSPQQAQVRLDSCQFEGNREGLVFSHQISGESRLDVTNSIFRGNQNNQYYYDLLRSTAQESNITNCLFEENEQAYWLFAWENTTMNFQNCVFRKNQPLDFMFGVNDGTLNIANCHFDANDLVGDYPFPFFVAQTNVANSIFTNNTGTPYVVPRYMNPHFEHCYFNALVANPPASVTFGAGILTAIDPLFQDAAAGNYRLTPCSPLVGAGINAAPAVPPTDLDGLPRIQGGTVDMGTYERPAPNLADAPSATASCPGAHGGAVAFEPENGCAPYTYAWSSGAASGQNLDSLAPGEYIFSVTDARGSGMSIAVTISEKPVPAPDPVTTLAVCGDTIGGSVALVTVGLSPFSFSWPDGAADSLRTGLAPGAYLVTVTDADGCTATDTVLVGTRGRLKVNFEVSKISCAGAADGFLAVLPQDGKAPFEWLWENGTTAPSLSPLGPGVYHGTLTDAFGCEIVWAVPLVEPDSISLVSTVANVSSSQPYNGSVSIDQISGGTTPYSVLWSTGAAGAAIDSLPPGVYEATVTDAAGCSLVREFVVTSTLGGHSPGETRMPASVFPNPFSELLTVRWASAPGDELSRFVLADVLGRVVATAVFSSGQATLRVSGLPAGVYFWQLWCGGRLVGSGVVEGM